MNVELTNYASPNDELVPRVVDLVKRHALEERILFSSFFPHVLRKARLLLPKSHVASLPVQGYWVLGQEHLAGEAISSPCIRT